MNPPPTPAPLPQGEGELSQGRSSVRFLAMTPAEDGLLSRILIISTSRELAPQPTVPIGAAWVAEALRLAGPPAPVRGT